MRFIEVESYKEMSRAAANIISAQIILKPDSVIGLATGSSPIGAYSQLIEWNKKGDLDFSEVKSVNLDEYYGLSPEHEQSYRYFMNTHLFDHVNIKKENTFVPNGLAEDPEKEGKEYDERIEKFGGIDLQLLGIGVDGHIGFNEPADTFVAPTHLVELDESTIEANSRFFESANDVPKKAMTMGMKSIMQAKKILMVVAGENKKAILENALYGNIDPKNPASILQIHKDVTVIYTKESY